MFFVGKVTTLVDGKCFKNKFDFTKKMVAIATQKYGEHANKQINNSRLTF